MAKKIFFSMLIGSLVVLSVGCKESTKVETPEGGSVTVNEGADGVDATITHSDGSKVEVKTAESGVEIPSDFPKDVPIVHGAKATATTKFGPVQSVTLQTSAAVADVTAFYKKAIAANGWETQGVVDTPSGATIGATKQGRSLGVTIFRVDNVTTISISISQMMER